MSRDITVRTEGLVLDEILAEEYGPVRARTEGRLEETLALNPGLAALGPVLPIGTVVRLPDKGQSLAPVAPRVVSLFG